MWIVKIKDIFSKKTQEAPPSIDDLKQKFSSVAAPVDKKDPVHIVEVEGDKEIHHTFAPGAVEDDVLERVILDADKSETNAVSESEDINKKSIAKYLHDVKESYEDARLVNLLIQQVKELIEIDNNLNAKIIETETALKREIEEREKLQKIIDTHYSEQKKLEKNMTKFISLYELVTNKFNPFISHEQQNATPIQSPQQIQGLQPMQGSTVTSPAMTASLDIPPSGVSISPSMSGSIPVFADSEPEKKEESIESGTDAKSIFAKLKARKEAQSKPGIQSPVNAPANVSNVTNNTIPSVNVPVQPVSTQVAINPATIATTVSTLPQSAPVASAKNPQVMAPIDPSTINQPKQTKILPAELHFQLKNGQTIQSLSQLLQYFQETSDTELTEYVTHYKNDFAGWVYNCFHNEFLSQNLSECKNREALIKVLDDYIRTH